jgi:hypothetical protein
MDKVGILYMGRCAVMKKLVIKVASTPKKNTQASKLLVACGKNF